jgi:hypothetical protein
LSPVVSNFPLFFLCFFFSWIWVRLIGCLVPARPLCLAAPSASSPMTGMSPWASSLTFVPSSHPQSSPTKPAATISSSSFPALLFAWISIFFHVPRWICVDMCLEMHGLFCVDDFWCIIVISIVYCLHT